MLNAKTASNAPAKQDGRRGNRRRAKAGDLDALARELWHCMTRVSDILDDPEADRADVLKAAHALSSVAGVYVRLIGDSETTQALEALRKELHEAREADSRPHSASARLDSSISGRASA